MLFIVLFFAGCEEQAPASTPNPPPQTENVMSQDPHKNIYQRWLTSKGDFARFITAGTPLGASTGPWKFFFVRRAPGLKEHPAAVHASGTLIAPGAPEGWFDYLSSDQELGHLHNQLAWLHGSWATLSPTTPATATIFKKHPKAEGHISAPEKTQADGSVQFSAWFYTPHSAPPFHFRIVASKDGTTTFRRTKLKDLPEKQ